MLSRKSIPKKLFTTALSIVAFAAFVFANGDNPQKEIPRDYYIVAPSPTDTIPFNQWYFDWLNGTDENKIDLKDPSIVKKEVEYDPVKNQYIITEKMGDENYRPATYMTYDEYMEWSEKESQKEYFRKLSGIGDTNVSSSGIVDPVSKFNIEDNLVDRLFGGTKVDIRPQGNIDLTFGWNYSRRKDPGLTIRQQTTSIFDFDMNINMSVQGKIGEKLNLNFNYNSKPTFDFDNQMKIQYDPTQFTEDDIIQNIEAGDVSLPLQGTLIQGAQSLFGIRLDTKWGKLKLSTIVAQQKSDRDELVVQGGAQFQEYEVYADEYEENRHFFLSHYNRDAFEGSLENLPIIRNVFKLERVQVFLTDDRNTNPDRLVDIVAFADLGEAERITNVGNVRTNPTRNTDYLNRPLPDNTSNDLFEQVTRDDRTREIQNAVFTLQSPPYNMQQSRDFEKVSAVILNEGRDYTVNKELGFVSLNYAVQPDHVIGISYQYSYNGEIYQVGEFSNKVPPVTFSTETAVDTTDIDTNRVQQVVFTKMLKSATQRVDLPLWDLMMKNVYNIGAYNVNPDDFQFGIYYDEPGIGEKQFLPVETGADQFPLISLFNLDRLNSQNDPCPDGEFDFVPGLTINQRNGRVMFPLLEPFGSSLVNIFKESPLEELNKNTGLIESRYAYDILYDSTVTRAREYPDKNRFVMRGIFKSETSNEIMLNTTNLPSGQGGLIVTAGGRVLEENVDYEVDRNLGRVRILNDAYISSGVPIKVSFENRALFAFQQKNLIGLRADYDVNKNLQVGGTYMHLFERPFTQKVNIGDDPINNRIYGLDMAWGKEVPLFTKMVDALPFIDTKVPSTINFTAEAAALQPGHSRAINEGTGDDKGGVVMIDDFEGAFPEITLSSAALQEWVLASVPQNDQNNRNPLFKEAQEPGTVSGVNRALLNWFLVDQTSRTQNSPYTDQVNFTEIFKEGQRQSFQNITRPLIINYNPELRGPYNFDVPDGIPGYSAGVNFSDGKLKDPASRWAGITRNIQNNDFEANNVEFIEFWMLSPYHHKDSLGLPSPDADRQKGDLYINIGNISEDALRDSRLSYENGLPGSSPTSRNRRTDATPWGNVPSSKPQVQAFDTDRESRAQQDVGLDGMADAEERIFYEDFVNKSVAGLDPSVAAQIQNDPSNDNFEYFLNKEEDRVLDKYRCFNNPEGNSPVNQGSTIPQSSRLRPDTEDLNDDRTLNEAEAYFQYRIPIEQDDNPAVPQGIKFNKFIRDSVVVKSSGETYRIWYNFQIPIDDYETAVGGIQDFRSIRFIRMFWHGFETETTFAMVDMKLTRSNWRKYKRPLTQRGPLPPELYPPTEFNITDVGLEENSTRVPFGYVMPEGIVREQSIGGFQQGLQQDEKSIAITMRDLQDGDARGIYKLAKQDLRLYDRMRMFVHAERDSLEDFSIEDGDLSAFIRFGSDFEDNYYEYELPLAFSDPTGLNPDDVLEYSREVWKEENDFDISFDLLKAAKKLRNDSLFALNAEFVLKGYDPEKQQATIRIKGNPDLGSVKGIMIGLRNELDDGSPHSAQIWVNELRCNGLDEQGGVAAIARMDIGLADFGQLTVAGNYSGIGYGGIDQKLIQRSQEEIRQYDLSAQFELGRFFGEKSPVKLPLLAQYSNFVSTPRFDPNTGDIELDVLKAGSDDVDALLDTVLTKSEIKTINLTNVRIEKTNTERKPKPWDISNFTASYGYTERNDSDPKTELAETKDHYGTLDYTWNMKPLIIKPFKKLIKKDKYLKFLSEFNFNPIPQSFTFGTAIDRDFHKTKRRFAGSVEQFNTFHEKKFLWDRDYNLNWDFARSLKFNFTATNMSIVDELKEFDQVTGVQTTSQEKSDYIWSNIRDLGRTRDYSHTASLSYQIPLKNFPFLEFINARAQYNASYGWTGASLNATDLGNVIQNSQKRDLSADLNFEKLYNKSSYLKKINRKSSSRKRSTRRNKVSDDKDKKNTIDNPKKKKKKKSSISKAEKAMIRPLMLLRSARLRYSEDFSTVVPGFMPQSKLLGMSQGFNAPGWEFVGGIQPTDAWFNQAADEWITDDFFLNQKVQQNYTQTIDGKVKIEPFPEFRIDIDLRKKFTENHSEYFKDREADGIRNIERLLPQDMGSLELTYFSANTLFGQDQDGIDLFKQYEANRVEISRRIGEPNTQHVNEGEEAYTRGYGKLQQDVLIPAFVSAYSGTNAATTRLNVFKTLPLPNWTINYNGLSKIGKLKDMFSSVSIRHGYKSTLRINTFRTDLNYDPTSPTGNSNINTETNNYYSSLEIPDVVIREGFSPLIGIDIETKNKISMNFSMDKQRDLQMNLFTYQLAENRTSSYKAGFQYTMQNVQFEWLKSKKKKGRGKKDKDKVLGNQNILKGGGSTFGNSSPQDLNIGMQFQLNDDITINHFLDQDIHERIRGQFVLRISPSLDYQLNNQLNLRLFVDYTNTRPKTSQTPPSTNIFGGLTVSFSLQ